MVRQLQLGGHPSGTQGVPYDIMQMVSSPMTIVSSSGLSNKDISRMVSDAKQYAETDKLHKTLRRLT
jgi:archaellum biogenesis protein FlaJ (TadC family)